MTARTDASPALREAFARQTAEYEPSAGMELAIALGLERITCSHCPGGGAPEKLVGWPAPSFSLQTLEASGGEELELRRGSSFRMLQCVWTLQCEAVINGKTKP